MRIQHHDGVYQWQPVVLAHWQMIAFQYCVTPHADYKSHIYKLFSTFVCWSNGSL